MSADNFIGVRPNNDGTYSVFEYGNMSADMEDCMYLADQTGVVCKDENEAMALATTLLNKMDICEYGIITMNKVPDAYCGVCYTCVHERNVIDITIPKCDVCSQPISGGEWRVYSHGKTMHHRCEFNSRKNKPILDVIKGTLTELIKGEGISYAYLLGLFIGLSFSFRWAAIVFVVLIVVPLLVRLKNDD